VRDDAGAVDGRVGIHRTHHQLELQSTEKK
jgi:hypothetical protein